MHKRPWLNPRPRYPRPFWLSCLADVAALIGLGIIFASIIVLLFMFVEP